ncbi:hypothetical protein D3C72_2417430 [compost metagenome]
MLNLRQLQVLKEQLNKGISGQQDDAERFSSAVLFLLLIQSFSIDMLCINRYDYENKVIPPFIGAVFMLCVLFLRSIHSFIERG